MFPVLVSWPHLAWLAGSLALCAWVARRHGGQRRDCLRLRAFLASGGLLALAHDRFRDNELAGVLVLYLPLCVACALCPALDRPGRVVWRLQFLLLAALFGGLLAATQSRGGLTAAAAGVAAVLWLSGRRGRRWLGALLAAGVVAAVAVGFESIAAFVVYRGSVQGLTPDVVLTGRPAIWHRAMHAVADFPVTGLGPGAFGASVDALYPSVEPMGVDDAHNLFLQTALDVGIPGLAVFLAFLAVLTRRLVAGWREASAGGLLRAQRLGLSAALGAHLLYSLTDSVSLGSPGGIAFWLACGLILSSTPPVGSTSRLRTRMVALVAIAAVSLPWLGSRLRHNVGAVAAARVLVGVSARAEAAVARLEAAGTCRARWFLGRIADSRGQVGRRDRAFSELVGCSAGHLELLQVVAPEDLRLAKLAAETWSDRAEAHFWLARATARSGGREEAVESYRRGLERDPSKATAWLELGDLLARADARAALDAYAAACRRGDPNANACARAGAMAEALGDVEAAAHWYRASRWRPARARAEALRAGGAEPAKP